MTKEVMKKVAGGLFSAYAIYRLYLLIENRYYTFHHISFSAIVSIIGLAGVIALAVGCFMDDRRITVAGTCTIAVCNCFYFLRAVVTELRYLHWNLWNLDVSYLFSEMCLAGAFVLLALYLLQILSEEGVGFAAAGAYLLGIISYSPSFRSVFMALFITGGMVLLVLSYSEKNISAGRIASGEMTRADGTMSDAVLKKLVELKKLLDMNVITQEEFNSKRDELLKRNKAETTEPAQTSIYSEFSEVKQEESTPGKVWFQ